MVGRLRVGTNRVMSLLESDLSHNFLMTCLDYIMAMMTIFIFSNS